MPNQLEEDMYEGELDMGIELIADILIRLNARGDVSMRAAAESAVARAHEKTTR